MAGDGRTQIETKRLLLRPHLAGDFEGYAALWARAPDRHARQSPLGDLNAEEAWARLLRFIGHWKVFGYGPFLAVERTSGTVVAEVGLARFRRDVGPNFDQAPEAMWKVDDRHQGKAIASEAMADIMPWFDARGEEGRTVCMIHATNTASIRIADRLGFQRFDQAIHRGNPVLLFERIRPTSEDSGRS